MAEKKPTTKAHRGFIHMRKPAGPADGRPRRRRQLRRGQPIQIGPDGRPIRRPRDPFNPFRPRRPRIPRFPFGRGRLGPADEPLDRRGRPIRSPLEGGRKIPFLGIRPTVEPQPIRKRRRPTGTPTPEQRALMKRQLDALANRGNRRARKGPLQFTQGLGRLGSSIFNRATRAQRRAKGGMIFKSKDYVNPSNTVDNKKK